ncbi:MAG TPA: formylglycine-generating enzyme family protein [Nitrospiraceae bacterium]|nr:formylglycine-generating enzyme family protein [Nitrospiraceae bacterium]
MLETKFKVAFLLVVLAFAAMPIIGILSGTKLTPFEESPEATPESSLPGLAGPADDKPIQKDMVSISAGPFIRGTDSGGFDERPQRTLVLSAFAIDRYEVTNFQYQQFVDATGHRKAGPPSRYAKNMGKMRGINQPVVYVSWEDAESYCRWKGKRLPTEAEWEKAMRGTDGRLWPWGNSEQANGANWARVQDGYDVTAPVGSFRNDRSPYGVMDGAGNVMEWVQDWYSESYYKDVSDQNSQGPEYGVYRVLRGGGYTTAGGDIRITSRSKMVPDFRDETIGFRCAVSEGQNEVGKGVKNRGESTENQSSRE